MKLASLRAGRDGELVLVDRALAWAVRATDIAPTLQRALDDWDELAPALERRYAELCAGRAPDAFALDPGRLAAPLPRAHQWLDGSAYLHHVRLVRRARGAEMPASFESDPLMYQGGSDVLLGPRDPIPLADEAWGCDFEAELAVIVGDLPRGADPARCEAAIRLFALVNDVSLRELIPGELAKGFGFLHGKPPTAFAPVAVTPDELGAAWREGRLHGRVEVSRNAERFGAPDAGRGMAFGFPELVAHAARTRPLSAGTIVGSGTISNDDPAAGSCCIAERRALETIDHGAPRTPYLRVGERVRIEMLGEDGGSIFGAIDQTVVPG